MSKNLHFSNIFSYILTLEMQIFIAKIQIFETISKVEFKNQPVQCIFWRENSNSAKLSFWT